MTWRERLRRLVPTPEQLAGNRWLRWLGPSLLHPRLWHVSRRGVAKGVAVGVFFAFITPIAQIPLSAAVSVLIRANVPWAVVGTLVNTPPTFGPVYYGAWKVGSWLLGEETDDKEAPVLPGSARPAPVPSATATTTSPHQAIPDNPPQGTPAAKAESGSWWQDTLQTLQNIGKPLMLGATVFSVVFSLLAYVLVNAGWHWRVRAKRRTRLARRR